MFAREFSSISDPDPNLACRSLRATCEFRFSELPGADCTSPGRSARSVGQHSVVTRPRRLNGTSGMTPIGSFTFSMPASAKTTGLVSEAVAPPTGLDQHGHVPVQTFRQPATSECVARSESRTAFR